MALVCAVAKRSGQVLNNDTVDPSALHILDHTLKVLPFQVCCSTGPIVNIGIHHFIKAVLKKTGYFIVQYFILVDYGFRDDIPIITGKADVFSYLPDHLLGSCFAGL